MRTVAALKCADGGKFGEHIFALVILNGYQGRKEAFRAVLRIVAELCLDPPVARFQWIIQVVMDQ